MWHCYCVTAYEYSIIVSNKPQNMLWGRVGVNIVHDELNNKQKQSEAYWPHSITG